MKPRIDAIARGYETGEYSHPTRSRDELRMDAGTTPPADIGGATPTPWAYEQACKALWKHRDERDRYAERNGELHVLCHDMLNALEYLGCEADVIHKFRSRLHNVPQCRPPVVADAQQAEYPMRRGY